MIWNYRTRLTVVNGVTMAAVLLIGAGLLHVVTHRLGMEAIDRDLMERARRPPGPDRRMAPEGPRPEGPPPGNAPPGDRMRPRLFHPDGSPLLNPQDRPLDPRMVNASRLPVWSMPIIDGEQVRVMTFHAMGPQGPAVGQVGRSMADFNHLQHAQAVILLWMTPLAILASAIAGAYLARRAIEPIQAMATAAHAIDDAHLDQRLPVVGDDEMASLGEAFNGMVSRLERSFSDLNTALEDQKRFVADASHELKTPLARARLATTSALSQDLTEAELLDALRTADAGIGSVTQLVHQLLDLARSERPVEEYASPETDLTSLVREAGQAYGIAVGDLGGRTAVRAAHDDLSRALSNLLDNAIRYGSPPVEISIVRQPGLLGISVRDHGPGVDPADVPNLGKRFFRPDEARTRESGGAGLGLAIVKATTEKWGGRLEIGLPADGGLKSTILFPTTDTSSSNPNNDSLS